MKPKRSIFELHLSNRQLSGAAAKAAFPALCERLKASGAEEVFAHFGGVAWPNPGQIAAGALIVVEGATPCTLRASRFLGADANSEAEYHGLLLVLRGLAALGLQKVAIYAQSDSAMVINQMKGRWQIDATRTYGALATEAQELLKTFDDALLVHCHRTLNREAKTLCERVLTAQGVYRPAFL